MTDYASQATKNCPGCCQSLPLASFGMWRTQKRPDRPRSRCRDCTNDYARRMYADRYKSKQKDTYLRTKYGIGIAERDAMMAAQANCCAICGAHADSGSVRWGTLSIDHHHASGQVRGLLCDHCNRGIGHFRDDPNLLLAAAAYLLQTTDVLAQVQ